MRRWVIGTLAGAVTVFVWGAISHMVLFTGIDFTRMPDDERIVSMLRVSLMRNGLYFYPSIGLRGKPTAEEEAAWEGRSRAGPTGIVVYRAAGDAPVSPKKMSVQALSHLLAAGIVSYVFSLTIATYWTCVGVAALLGVFGLFAISSIYWNWYGFPNAFFVAQAVDVIGGWSLATAVTARIVPAARS